VRQFTRLLTDERYRDRLSALLDQTAQAPQALPAEPDRTPLPTYDRSERPAPLSPDIVRVGPDTIRIEPDTVYMVRDAVQLPPDTVRETTVVEVQRALLDTGTFRAFEVNFAFGESTLLPRATRSLDVVGEVLAKYPELRVEIAGHTDAVGTEDDNRTLSDARAQSVREYLTNRFGIAPQRLVARGYGEARPIATNETEAGRALNRRVEFVVLNPAAAFLRAEGRNPSNEPAANEAGQDLETMIRRAIQEELDAYNPLIPEGRNWKATMMIEYADREERTRELARLAGIEAQTWVQIAGHDKVFAIADEDLDRSTEDKTSAVHFLRFELDAPMCEAVREGAAIALGIDHPSYRMQVDAVAEPVRTALAADLD